MFHPEVNACLPTDVVDPNAASTNINTNLQCKNLEIVVNGKCECNRRSVKYDN